MGIASNPLLQSRYPNTFESSSTTSYFSLTETVISCYHYIKKWLPYQRKLKKVHILLRGKLGKLTLIIPALRIHIIDHPDGEQF